MTSFSLKPLLVTAGVPILIPEVTNGDLGSLGTEFLLTVIKAFPNAASRSLPVTSFFMRFLLRAMRHEGYSYNIDIFNLESVVNDKRDLWSANCAVPEVLFNDIKDFENYFTNLKIDYKIMREYFKICLVSPELQGYSHEKIEEFSKIINLAGYSSPVRTPRGQDIMAACGQLKSISKKIKKSHINVEREI